MKKTARTPKAAAMGSPQATPPRSTDTLLFIDEIEDDEVRVLMDERVFTLPRAALPEGVKEGDWLTMQLTQASAPPDDSAAGRQRLGQDDPGGDIKL
jgi:hypothetical protein